MPENVWLTIFCFTKYGGFIVSWISHSQRGHLLVKWSARAREKISISIRLLLLSIRKKQLLVLLPSLKLSVSGFWLLNLWTARHGWGNLESRGSNCEPPQFALRLPRSIPGAPALYSSIYWTELLWVDGKPSECPAQFPTVKTIWDGYTPPFPGNSWVDIQHWPWTVSLVQFITTKWLNQDWLDVSSEALKLVEYVEMPWPARSL